MPSLFSESPLSLITTVQVIPAAISTPAGIGSEAEERC